jgi:calcineurin-like phosphoesterase family protein
MAVGRGFKDAYEMEDYLIKQWNMYIRSGDHVYHLGDFGFQHKRLAEIRHRLRGKIHLIVGNHDKKNKIEKQGWFTSIHELVTINIDKQPIVLCHYEMKVWDKSHYNSYCLFGHSHTGLNSPSSHYSSTRGKSIDVGVDNFEFKPVSYEQIKEIMSKQPDNFNLVRRNDG